VKYPKVVIRKTDVERWTLTIDGVDVPNVKGVSYQREVGSFPFVTFTLIAELFQGHAKPDERRESALLAN